MRPLRAGSVLSLAAATLVLTQMAGRAPAAAGGPLPSWPPQAIARADSGDVTQGALRVTRGGQEVECPLRHTDVRAEVAGFVSRVRVVQTFENPYDEAIEAVYVFPLPHGAAVDEMTMIVGERRIAAVIKRRGEARAVYEQALRHGQTASLLEQERPNIFTQSVGNIPPGQQVRVEIAYVDLLPYEAGRYEFHFPMVVGPRYIPGAATGGRPGGGWARDTDRVPDASRITPPVLKPGQRTGHDVSLSLTVLAGVPITRLHVHNHEAEAEVNGVRATVALSPADAIPNKDFVASYYVAGEKPQAALLSHAIPGQDGYFLLMLQPRELEQALAGPAPARDVCFLIDVSGSMSGEPIAKVAEAMERFFQRMRPEDRLQVVSFAGSADRLFPGYVPASGSNLTQALEHTRAMRGGGGTEMMAGIRAVLADPVEPERVRVIVMLTDGYIGNEDEIIGEVGRRGGDQVRFWTVGIGSSPNRHLLDGVARQGGGSSMVLGLKDDPTPLVDSAMDRIQRAQLSRISVDWGGMDVFETYPASIGELWSGKPVFLLGRYRGAGQARVELRGLAEGEPVAMPVPVTFAAAVHSRHEPPDTPEAVLPQAWARKKIEHLTDQMAVAGASEELVEEVTSIALQHRLMSAYTSFVAVDTSQPAVESPLLPRRMMVPVPMPEGVSYEGVFGPGGEEDEAYAVARSDRSRVMAPMAKGSRQALRVGGNLSAMQARPQMAESIEVAVEGGVPGGVEGGVAGGIVGGIVGGLPDAPPPLPARPSTPAAALTAPSEVKRLEMADGRAYRRNGGPAASGALQKLADEAMAEARRRQAASQFDEAGRALERALLAETALQQQTPYPLGRLAAAQAARDAATAAHEERATRLLPALEKRLDVVLRNMDLAAALGAVAQAAGVALDIAPGSLEDVQAAYGRAAVRIAHLDLRGARAAQALTWLAQPARLTWRVERGRIAVRSARRDGGAWVYTLEGADEAARRKALDAIRAAVAGDPRAVVERVGDDLVLVSATAAAHARIATAAGAADGAIRARDVRQARATVHEWTWRLLGAALQGGLDDAAASELLEAWTVPGVAVSTSDVLALRSLWAIGRARAARPGDGTLGRLWDTARSAAASAPPPAATAAPSPAAVAYARLLRDEQALALGPWAANAEASPLLRLFTASDTAAADEVTAALAAHQLRGDDALVLAALGLRQRGGQPWLRFRQSLAETARAARASGGALLVANRLEGRR